MRPPSLLPLWSAHCVSSPYLVAPYSHWNDYGSVSRPLFCDQPSWCSTELVLAAALTQAASGASARRADIVADLRRMRRALDGGTRNRTQAGPAECGCNPAAGAAIETSAVAPSRRGGRAAHRDGQPVAGHTSWVRAVCAAPGPGGRDRAGHRHRHRQHLYGCGTRPPAPPSGSSRSE